MLQAKKKGLTGTWLPGRMAIRGWPTVKVKSCMISIDSFVSSSSALLASCENTAVRLQLSNTAAPPITTLTALAWSSSYKEVG